MSGVTDDRPELGPPSLPAPGERWALMLDVDGTLLDFALRPELVRVDTLLHMHLGWLAGALDGALALVSGRRTSDLARLFAPLPLEYVGLHGLEHLHADGRHEQLWQEDAEQTRRLHGAAERVAADLRGVRVEYKGPSVALHCREAPAQMGPMRVAASALAASLPGYVLLEGYEVCELKPALADKGVAVRALMREPAFAGRRPVYVGDDHTDTPALKAVRDAGGIAVAVGSRVAGSATHVLACPGAVRAWLAELARPGPRTGRPGLGP